MEINTNNSFPSLNKCKLDINKILNQKQMKPSDTTEEELFEATKKNYDQQVKEGAATNYWAGLYAADSCGDISSNQNEKIIGILCSKDYTITDPQFMTNFVAKESFYEDTIKSKYSGKELQDKLDDLHKVADDALDKLSDAFANGIGNFMNGNLGWLYGEYTNTAGISSQNFDVKEFKNHIVDVVKNEEKTFNNIKAQNQDEWKQVINNYGEGLQKFTAKLESFSSSNSTNSNRFEDMSYGDIKALGTVINSLGGGEYTNSAADLGSYLGQMKLKGDIMIENSNMSSNLKQTLSKVISRNIATKIASFSNSQYTIGGESEVLNSFSSFAKLSNTNLQQFRTEYSNSLNMLKNSLLQGASNSSESPYSNNVRFANDIIALQVNNWNSFVDKLNLSNDTKKYLYVNGSSGNTIDSTI
ncbi:hypothetical protein [Clostridium hydrogenum]|uniref:hypothetical protein n=1 Tax=Clostridium hydrogenum TaxID=2855764 RepID=UPI001F361C6B|nr:hypothetical protein [Clostridium hydrogenum]